uniref:Uncharacterized protein n=1 Tax=Amphimedon queenslandica TaxID=400682 RepID=A0A1X7TLE7_AMPQE
MQYLYNHMKEFPFAYRMILVRRCRSKNLAAGSPTLSISNGSLFFGRLVLRYSLKSFENYLILEARFLFSWCFSVFLLPHWAMISV